MPEVLNMADKPKKNRGRPKAPERSDDDTLTTVKARKEAARIIRQICAIEDKNQEEVIDLCLPFLMERLRTHWAKQFGKPSPE